jgi:hypothetical protein
MKRLYIFTILVLFITIKVSAQDKSADTTRILFIGNSYTFMNNLPGTFAKLSESGGEIVKTDISAIGGTTLEKHSRNKTTIDKIKKGKWNYVVLQEHSLGTVIDSFRVQHTYPAINYLDSLIKTKKAKTLLYMTWGRKKGGEHILDTLSTKKFKDYFEMQAAVEKAYRQMGKDFGAQVVPAGLAWQNVIRKYYFADLWDEDESHPKLEATYLNACVFYATVFKKSPVGLTYTAGIDKSYAKFLQETAYSTYKQFNGIQ